MLVAEDEVPLRERTRTIRSNAGYRVLEAAGAEEAMRWGETTGPECTCFSPVVTPGTNGRELAERLLAVHPNVKVLFMSGYSDELIAHRGVLGVSVLIQKPCNRKALLGRIREPLGAR